MRRTVQLNIGKIHRALAHRRPKDPHGICWRHSRAQFGTVPQPINSGKKPCPRRPGGHKLNRADNPSKRASTKGWRTTSNRKFSARSAQGLCPAPRFPPYTPSDVERGNAGPSERWLLGIPSNRWKRLFVRRNLANLIHIRRTAGQSSYLAIARKQPALARAVALGRWGGFRKQMICAIPVDASNKRPTHKGEETRLKWVTQKRKVLCDRREEARLFRQIEATPSYSIHIAYNAYGDPWKPRSLSQGIDRLVEHLAKIEGDERPGAKKVRPNLTILGLRHSSGVELARTGASDAEIMAQLDHATSRAAAIYQRRCGGHSFVKGLWQTAKDLGSGVRRNTARTKIVSALSPECQRGMTCRTSRTTILRENNGAP